MSRISHNPAHDAASAGAQRATDAQQRSANAQNARNSAQFAALYRGETTFTYGSAPQSGPTVSSQRARRMADSLARKRRAEKRQQRNLRRGGDDEGAGERGGAHGERLRVTRDGGQRGGGGGQSQDERDGDHDALALPSVKPRLAAVIPPPSGRLEAIAARFGPGEEGARAAAVRDAWESDLLALHKQVAANPQTDVGALVHQLKIDWLQVEQQIGAMPRGGGIAALRERGGTQADRAGHAVGARPLLPERARHFNLLVGLLWKDTDLPHTRARGARALGALNALRNGVLGRAAAAHEPQDTAQNASTDTSGNTAPPGASSISAFTRGRTR
ncbi:hypothetical protein FHX57_002722 [Paraburkholderia tropica]|uniref:hypothetical protein n=1 Tax=Paraburkholderia tropica TaxID=92647 RepID=UPI0016176DF0|nr:hypothetical protein [Paraburkholderia tropica]MBB3000370.1 hypothetical protein [Paraburkholderia tropica]